MKTCKAQRFFMPALLALLLPLCIGNAQALPLLQYTINGQISEQIAGGASVRNIVGAEFTMVYLLRAGEPPAETIVEDGLVRSRYTAQQAYGEVFNRPNAAADFQFHLHTLPQAETQNRFAPATDPDLLFFHRPERIAAFTIIGTDEFYRFEPGSLSFLFENLSFFGGTGVAPLPIFDMSQIAAMSGGISIINGGWYRFTPTSVSVAEIATPSTLLLAPWIAMLAVLRQRQKRLRVRVK